LFISLTVKATWENPISYILLLQDLLGYEEKHNGVLIKRFPVYASITWFTKLLNPAFFMKLNLSIKSSLKPKRSLSEICSEQCIKFTALGFISDAKSYINFDVRFVLMDMQCLFDKLLHKLIKFGERNGSPPLI